MKFLVLGRATRLSLFVSFFVCKKGMAYAYVNKGYGHRGPLYGHGERGRRVEAIEPSVYQIPEVLRLLPISGADINEHLLPPVSYLPCQRGGLGPLPLCARSLSLEQLEPLCLQGLATPPPVEHAGYLVPRGPAGGSGRALPVPVPVQHPEYENSAAGHEYEEVCCRASSSPLHYYEPVQCLEAPPAVLPPPPEVPPRAVLSAAVSTGVQVEMPLPDAQLDAESPTLSSAISTGVQVEMPPPGAQLGAESAPRLCIRGRGVGIVVCASIGCILLALMCLHLLRVF